VALWAGALANAAAWQLTATPGRWVLPRSGAVSLAAPAGVSVDGLIDQLKTASPQQMKGVLAENIKLVDQKFFLRLAELADEAESGSEKDSIADLASTVARTVEEMVKFAEERLDDDASKVQDLMKLVASPSGEFVTPFPPEKKEALRAAIRERGESLDDGFVGTVKAYMGKADGDGMVEVVDVLRELLQVFAAERLLALVQVSIAKDAPAIGDALRTVLESNPSGWDAALRASLIEEGAECGAEEFLGALQDKMGEVVLGMPSGSALQAVLAEYLSELLGRARAVIAEAA